MLRRPRLISYFDEEMQIPANPFLTCPTRMIVLCFFTTKDSRRKLGEKEKEKEGAKSKKGISKSGEKGKGC